MIISNDIKAILKILSISTVFIFLIIQNVLMSNRIKYLVAQSPVNHKITGFVQKITDKFIYLDKDTEEGRFVYKISYNQETIISEPKLYLNYLLFNQSTDLQEKLQIKNIAIGQMISINTIQDLRTTSNGKITAETIEMPMKANGIIGTIMTINNNELTLKARPTDYTSFNPGEESTYIVKIDASTEISRQSSDTKFLPVSYKIDDLKQNSEIFVYADIDLAKESTFTALRIEPIIPVASTPVPTATPIPTPIP